MLEYEEENFDDAIDFIDNAKLIKIGEFEIDNKLSAVKNAIEQAKQKRIIKLAPPSFIPDHKNDPLLALLKVGRTMAVETNLDTLLNIIAKDIEITSEPNENENGVVSVDSLYSLHKEAYLIVSDQFNKDTDISTVDKGVIRDSIMYSSDVTKSKIVSIDSLGDIDINELMVQLTEMELEGLIVQKTGLYYITGK